MTETRTPRVNTPPPHTPRLGEVVCPGCGRIVGMLFGLEGHLGFKGCAECVRRSREGRPDSDARE